jgi:predicted dehydrogenase
MSSPGLPGGEFLGAQQAGSPIGAPDARPLRVAAAGLGWVTLHRHIPVMRRMRDVEIVLVVDRRPERASDVARRFRIPRHVEAATFRDVDGLDQVDAVTIGAAPESHFELAHSALQRGKHVLLEKPFAMSLDEGERLVAAARDAGVVLAIVHNFQFARSARRLAGDLDAGRLGRIRSLVARQFGNPRRRLPTWYETLPLGLFYDESPHLLYLLRRFAPGPLRLEAVRSTASTTGLNTPALLDAHFVAEAPSGPVPASLYLNFESPVSEWFLAVLGDEGAGIVDVFRDIYIRLPNDGAHTTATVLRTSLAATFQHWAQHLTSGALHLTGRLSYGNDEVFRRFVDAVRSGCPPDLIGPADAIDVLRIQHQVIDQCRKQG